MTPGSRFLLRFSTLASVIVNSIVAVSHVAPRCSIIFLPSPHIPFDGLLSIPKSTSSP